MINLQAPSTTFKNICWSACMTKTDFSAIAFSPGQEELLPSLLCELCRDQALAPLGEQLGPCVWCLVFIQPPRARNQAGWQQGCSLCWDLGLRNHLISGGYAPLRKHLLKCAWSPNTLAPLFKVGLAGVEYNIQATRLTDYFVATHGPSQTFPLQYQVAPGPVWLQCALGPAWELTARTMQP